MAMLGLLLNGIMKMTTLSPPVSGRAPVLLSKTQWAQNEALSFIASIVQSNFALLDDEQKNSYPQLHRKAQADLEAVETEIKRIKDTFKSSQIAALKRELKTLTGVDINPEQARIYTRYRENIHEDLNEYLSRISGDKPAREPRFTFSPPRTTRALDESRFIERVHSVTLWDAACENFSYRTDSRLLKPYSYEQASHIDYAEGLNGQAAGPFIAIARRLDFGVQLNRLLEQAAGPAGSLMRLAVDAAKSSIEFELLEALRNNTVSKVQRRDHELLLGMLKGNSTPHLWPVSMGLARKHRFIHPPVDTGADGRLLFGSQSGYDFIGKGSVALPLFIIKVPEVMGVFSYFPNRLGGAVLWHTNVGAVFQQFVQQLKQDHSKGQLGWFVRQLALKDLGFFNKLLGAEPRPEGLSWLAGVLYDSFRSTFPEPDLDSLQLSVEMSAAGSPLMAHAMAERHMQRYRSNLNMLATPKSEQDWQAFKEALTDIGSEVLSLLTTPMPGGVLGLNKIMQGAIFGSLAYSVVQGVKEAGKGEASTFASALADSMDMLISGRLTGVASKAHRQRMNALWNHVGQPIKVIHQDGRTELWDRQLSPYSQVDATLLDTLTPNHEGIYPHMGKAYAKVQEGDKTLAIEVILDPVHKHYVLKAVDAQVYRPPVVFDTVTKVWRLALDDVQSLSDVQLLQRMLVVDTQSAARGDIERMLSITATSRQQLQDTWQGQPIPGPLADGVRRLMADRLIEHIVTDLPLRVALPVSAHRAVLSVLTQLDHWPVEAVLDVLNPQGTVIESYGKDYRPGTPLNRIQVKRLDHGAYAAKDDLGQGSTQVHQLLALVLDQLPETSMLGREDSPGRDRATRITAIGEQVCDLAREDKTLLFKALTGLEGHARNDPIASADAGRKYLPLVCPPISDSTTPLLAKLHELNPSLSIESLESLLVAHPFNTYQVSRALEHNAQPLPFASAVDQLKIKLRVDQALDGIYHPRAHTRDMDGWAREFARGALHDKLNRRLVVTDAASVYTANGADDTSVVLRHHGNGSYAAFDYRRQENITFSSTPDSFYLALGWLLKPHERSQLGMQGISITGLRKTLGDAMLASRQADGRVSLWDKSTAQYQRAVALPLDQPPGELGLYEIEGKHHLSLYGVVYQVELDATLHKWRLKHPDKVGVNTPLLEHNGDGAWRLKSENPLHWSRLQLLRRLRAEPQSVSDETAQAIMAVSNTDEGVLRQVHMNNLTPPPLLIDTWKRFGIERDIRGFVKKMQAAHTLPDARTDLQLLLMQSMPGWPRDKVLQVVDAQGNTLQQYGTDLGSHVPRIRILRDDTHNGSFLRALLSQMNEGDTRVLLGDYTPVIEARMLVLAKKIAAHALEREVDVFNTLYQSLEQSTDTHVVVVQYKYPQLPKSVINNLLRHTTGREKAHFLDQGLIPPRLAEQITWTSREVRLARAYEGLFMEATATPDSERLMLHMLESLSGWPANVRIEVRRNDVNGQLLDSIGSAGGRSPRRLVRRDGRYRAYDQDGQALNAPSTTDNNLLASILHVLNEAERGGIAIKDVNDTRVLAKKISDLAIAHRSQVKTLLGLEPPNHRIEPPMKVDTSFVAYPFFLNQGQSNHPLDLVRQVRSLYPRMNYVENLRFLDALGGTDASRRAEVERLRVELETLLGQLASWERIQLYPTAGTHVAMALPGERRRVCELIERAWRRDTETISAQASLDGGYLLVFNGIQAGDLPALTGDFSHIRGLHMDNMNLHRGSNEFLNSFSQLHVLTMSDNRLRSLPPAIANMPRLTTLNLSYNNIVLSPESAQQLAGCTALQALRLDNNSLGITPDVSRMTALRYLNLSHTGITSWPAGLQGLTHLEEVNLRHNNIVTIEQTLFEAPGANAVNSVTRIHGNPISAESRDRLIDYWGRTGIHMGYIPAVDHAHAFHEARYPTGDISPWLSSGLSAVQRQQKLQQWALLKGFEGKANDLLKLLSGLAQAQADMSAHSRLALHDRVWTLIDRLLADTALRDLLFQSVHYDATCRDGVMVLLDNLEVQVLIHQAENLIGANVRETQHLNLAKGLFRLRQVDQIADAVIAERLRLGGHPDVAEIQLFYRIQLAEALGLPIQTRSMFSAPIAGISAAQITEAKDSILAMDAGPALKHSIMQEVLWRNFLHAKHTARFEAIEEQYQKDYTKLSEDSELSDDLQLLRGAELTDSRDQKLNLLVEELTDAALQGADQTPGGPL